MPFRLKDGVFFISGSLRGAILDTNTGNVYSVNEQACRVLSYEVDDDEYWDILSELNLADHADNPVLQQLPRLSEADRLRFVWFEIVTDDCNERCIHCYADSMPITYRKEFIKNSNLTAQETKEMLAKKSSRPRMSHKDWLQSIGDAYRLGCRSCQFIGGEPFLYRGSNGETVIDLAEYAVNQGYSRVEIYTNGTLLNERKVRRIKDLGIQIAVSLYSNRPETHELITRTPGSYKKTLRAIELLRAADVPTRVEVVLMKTNQHTVEDTLQLRRDLGANGKQPDPLRPTGRGNSSRLQPDFEYLARYGLRVKPNFVATRATISRCNTGHSCLLGKVTITEFGDVLPCIFSRDYLLGNFLSTRDLSLIVDDKKTQRVWHATKSNVLVCRDCEYRFVCSDCRPLSQAASNGNAEYLNAPYPRCTYNPYTGEWKGGLWRVNDRGQPFYDRRFASELSRVFDTPTTGDVELC